MLLNNMKYNVKDRPFIHLDYYIELFLASLRVVCTAFCALIGRLDFVSILICVVQTNMCQAMK